MKTFQLKTLVAAAAALLATASAWADVNIGVTLSLTGPASGLGIPVGNQFKLWPPPSPARRSTSSSWTTPPTPPRACSNARRFVTEDKVDMIIGGSITPVAGADGAGGRRGQDHADRHLARWACRPAGRLDLPPAAGQSRDGHPIVEHMKKNGVKTVGFLGYTDAYGELWLKEFTAEAGSRHQGGRHRALCPQPTPASRRRR
jgi:branched-chain amino acid transport system substrate-binding protein